MIAPSERSEEPSDNRSALRFLDAVCITAKNGGLVRQVDLALEALGARDCERRSVRGEDVPLLANDLVRRGRPVIALTGEDLIEEWLAAGNQLDPRLSCATRPWVDPAALFGSPALCLIGSDAESLVGPKRIAICNKYRNLAERFVRTLERRGCVVEPIYLNGALENVQLLGLAEFIIDVVVTGETVRKAGLVVREVFARSDLAVLRSVPPRA